MTTHLRPAKPINREGYWYLVRRVPKRYAAFEQRRHVTWSTGIAVWQDPRGIRAAEIVRERDAVLQRYWQDRAQGKDTRSPAEFYAARARAKKLHLTYKPAYEVANTDLYDLFCRFMALTNTWGEQALTSGPPNAQVLSDLNATLGGIAPPADSNPQHGTLMVSGMLAEYEAIHAAALALKSPRQLDKWRVRRQSGLDLFLSVIGGDKPFADLTRADARLLRTHWNDRVLKGEVRINSANRQIRQVSGLYAALKDFNQIDGPGIFDKLLITGGKDGKRAAFDPAFVQRHYLADGMFDELNPEARRIIYLIIETGLRLSEACALTKDCIRLDAPVPYVDVQAIDRVTKTPESVRQIPLVGVALMAMQEQPNGFPRYYDNADAASALINKAIDNRKLRPGGPKQTLYSMRHTIVDRLRAVEAPDKIQEDILGHKHTYGEGTTIEHRHRWLMKIAFKPPSRV